MYVKIKQKSFCVSIKCSGKGEKSFVSTLSAAYRNQHTYMYTYSCVGACNYG